MKKYILLISAALCSCGISGSGLSGSEAGSDFVYLRMTDAFIPIPTRYVIIPKGSSGEVKFSSSPYFHAFNLSGEIGESAHVGSIAFSTYNDCTPCKDDASAAKVLGEFRAIEITHNLTVLQSNNDEETNAIFYDRNYAVYVSDSDPELIGAMVKRIARADGAPPRSAQVK